MPFSSPSVRSSITIWRMHGAWLQVLFWNTPRTCSLLRSLDLIIFHFCCVLHQICRCGWREQHIFYSTLADLRFCFHISLLHLAAFLLVVPFLHWYFARKWEQCLVWSNSALGRLATICKSTLKLLAFKLFWLAKIMMSHFPAFCPLQLACICMFRQAFYNIYHSALLWQTVQHISRQLSQLQSTSIRMSVHLNGLIYQALLHNIISTAGMIDMRDSLFVIWWLWCVLGSCTFYLTFVELC